MQPAPVLNIEDELSLLAGGTPALAPAQKAVAADLASSVAAVEVTVLRVAPGMGRTTVLRVVHVQTGGAFVVARQILNLVSKRTPDTAGETFLELLSKTLDRNDLIFLDDLHLLTEVIGRYHDKRVNRIDASMTAILDNASHRGKKFVFSVSGENAPAPVRERAIVWEMEEFEPEDYGLIAENYLGSAAARLDMARVHRFAPALTAYEIKYACLWLGLRYAAPDTDSLMDYLGSNLRKLAFQHGE